MVDEMLDRMAADGHADVVDRLAFPLPFDVIAEMLGMPESDKESIKVWSGDLVKTLDPVLTDDEILAARSSAEKMNALIDDVIEWKTANPADDLLTAMIDAEDGGDRMSKKELRDQVELLFVAGHETTVNLIGTGLYELLKHPEQLAIIRDEGMPASAIDELLRWVSPVQISRRVATADLALRGKQIRRARSCSPRSQLQTTTPSSGATPPRPSIFTERMPDSTSRSGPVCTTASVHRSRSSKPRWRSDRSCSGSVRSASSAIRSGTAGSTFAVSSR